MGCRIGQHFNTFLGYCNGVLREPDGTPSSTRLLLYIFSAFDMWLVWRIMYHVLRIDNPALLGTWLANLPMLIGALIGLAAIPYTVNRGATAMSDMGNYFAQLKNGVTKLNDSPVAQKVNEVVINQSNVDKPSTVTTITTQPATGTPGPKG